MENQLDAKTLKFLEAAMKAAVAIGSIGTPDEPSSEDGERIIKEFYEAYGEYIGKETAGATVN